MSFVFARFRRELAARTGIALGADKQYLAESRLAPVMRAHDVANMSELLRRLERGDSEALTRETIDAMTTNETSFFRDRAPFEAFRERILPELLTARSRDRRLRIWCAACSTGQEVYSLAMTLDREAGALRGWSVDILATDLSRSAIETARKGSYSQFEVQRGLPTSQLLRYFHRDAENWRVNEHLRARIIFRDFNLLSEFGELGKFDAVFCRNVLLYFEPESKQDILSRLAKSLADDGYLVLGSAENVGEAGGTYAPAGGGGVFRRRVRARPQLRLA